MDKSQGTLDIAICNEVIYVKVGGLADMNNCMVFLDLTTTLLEEGYNQVVIDLAECIGMDSTFLGVLAAIATHGTAGRGPTVLIVNASKDCLSSLRCVGLTKFVEIKPEPVETPKVETFRIRDEDIPDSERVKFIREAHERLLLIDQHNRELFGPLLRMLSAELAARPEKPPAEENGRQ